MSEAGGQELELLFMVVKDYHLRDQILEGFLELGIAGATVVEARGMAQVLARDVPIFAGLVSLFPGGNTDSHLIFSVLPAARHSEVARLVQDVTGGFERPGSGIMFAVPVKSVQGLAEPFR